MSVTIANNATSLAEYFKGLTTNPNNIHSLEDPIEFIKKTEVEEYPRYDVATFELAVNKAHYASETYKKLEELRSYIVAEGRIEGALDRKSLDILVVPTAANTPVSFASLGGSPIIAIPLGFYRPETPVVKDKKSDLIAVAPGIPLVYPSLPFHCFPSFSLFLLRAHTLIHCAVVFQYISFLGGLGNRHC